MVEKNKIGHDNRFIGYDGKEYSSQEELSKANVIFENKRALMDKILLLRQMLGQFRRDIKADLESSVSYVDKILEGNNIAEMLDLTAKECIEKINKLIGLDGKTYSSQEQLFRANAMFENRQSMVQMLEQLKHDVAADIEKRKFAYIGKDGKDYYDIKSLDSANKAYIERMYTFIGRDGREYSTTKE